MADLNDRLQSARRALAAFEALLGGSAPADPVRRDAAILRFIFAFESSVAAVRHYLREVELEERGSPGACIRASRGAGLVRDEEAEALLAAAQDRNRAVHVYDEAMAQALFDRLAGHAAVMRRWMEAVAARAGV